MTQPITAHPLASKRDSSTSFQEGRLPESIAGLPRDAAHRIRDLPQGLRAPVLVGQHDRGLGPVPSGMWAIAPLRVLLVDPHLPEWLPDLS